MSSILLFRNPTMRFYSLIALFGIIQALSAVISSPLEPRQTGYAAYGFIYFTGEGLSNGEQIYFAVSPTNSPVSWTIVNSGRPVLTSSQGTRGLRDPYIIRHPTTGKFFVIATDLKIYGGAISWDASTRVGSKSIAIWESTDLKTWSAQRLVQVSPATAGMTWAPEATWDPSTSRFVVYWASKIYSASDTSHTGSTYSRIMYATTTDFVTFTAAQVWIDTGVDIIDTSVAWDATSGYYHRFSKTQGIIIQERSRTLFGTWTRVASAIGQSGYGDLEGPLIFLSNVYANVWHLWMDDLSPQGYVPFESANITSGVWTHSNNHVLPTNPRHGTVFGITAAEKANLLATNV